MSEKRLDEILGASQQLAGLAGEARRQSAKSTSLIAILPSDYQPHVHTAGIEADGTLTLGCVSAAWASRLRFAEKDLIRRYGQAGVPVARIAARVRPQA